MSIVILLEGVDGCGKTTIAQKLIDKYKFSYIHLSKLKENQDIYSYYDNILNVIKYNKNLQNDIILDRGYLTNIVYCNLFNDDKQIINEHLIKLHNLIDLGIIGLPNKKLYLEDYENIKQNRVELYDNMVEVYSEFEKLWLGQSNLKTNNQEFIDYINKSGGLQNIDKFVKYDRFEIKKDKIINWVENKIKEVIHDKSVI